MLRISRALLVSVSSMLAAGDARADFGALGTANSFNQFILGNSTITSSVDSQGIVAIGGNATFNNFTLADSSAAVPYKNDSLIVGGSLTDNGGLQVGYNGQSATGNVEIGGTSSISGSTTIHNGTLTSNLGSNLPVNFASEGAFLKSLSQTLNAQPNQLSVTNNFNTLTFAASNSATPMTNYFSISASTLASGNSFYITGSSATTVVINVVGDGHTALNLLNNQISLSNGSVTADHVLFNFVNIPTLSITNFGFYGTILAPNSAVTTSSGQINGNLIAGSYSGNAETHIILNGNQSGPNVLFTGNLPAVAVPEPQSLSLLALGGLGSLLLARSRRPS